MLFNRITQKLIKYLTPVLWDIEFADFTKALTAPLKDLNKSKLNIYKPSGMDVQPAINCFLTDWKTHQSILNTIQKSSIQKEVGDARYHPKN